jgi:hypothetical protein
MRVQKGLLFIICFFCGLSLLMAQIPARRLDTTMKVGRVGYRLSCFNKSPEKNPVTISPQGFDKDVREFSFEVKGRISKAEVDDINRDGFPDLVFYVFSNDSLPKGNVIAISSEKNETIAPIMFPDIFDDPKARLGYKGGDEFFLMEGNLVRRFPVFPVEGAPATASTGKLVRQINYMIVPGERGGSKFKIMRIYDFTKQ